MVLGSPDGVGSPGSPGGPGCPNCPVGPGGPGGLGGQGVPVGKVVRSVRVVRVVGLVRVVKVVQVVRVDITTTISEMLSNRGIGCLGKVCLGLRAEEWMVDCSLGDTRANCSTVLPSALCTLSLRTVRW